MASDMCANSLPSILERLKSIMAEIAIVGAGDLGRQIFDLLQDKVKSQRIHFFDDFKEVGPNGKKVSGSVDDCLASLKSGELTGVVFAIGYEHLHRKIELLGQFVGFSMPNVLHHSVVLSASAVLEGGVVLYPGVILDERCKIGRGAVLNLGSIVAHDSRIGQGCFLAPGVVVAGNVSVGDGCYLSTGCKLGSGVILGSGWTVAAGAVVLESFCENPKNGEFLAGIPAKVKVRK